MSIPLRIVSSALLAWAGLVTLILLQQFTLAPPAVHLLLTVLVIEIVAFRRYRGTSVPWQPHLVMQELKATIPLACGLLTACVFGLIWLQLVMATMLIATGLVFEFHAFRRIPSGGLMPAA